MGDRHRGGARRRRISCPKQGEWECRRRCAVLAVLQTGSCIRRRASVMVLDVFAKGLDFVSSRLPVVCRTIVTCSESDLCEAAQIPSSTCSRYCYS
ncbi:hypothetical protein BJX61DRAFT_527454 [Aspergillus egyptiacus]|nr:hypothetical protein BJX61DRAFT_527454 [Aspergillus egyptiacus]